MALIRCHHNSTKIISTNNHQKLLKKRDNMKRTDYQIQNFEDNNSAEVLEDLDDASLGFLGVNALINTRLAELQSSTSVLTDNQIKMLEASNNDIKRLEEGILPSILERSEAAIKQQMLIHRSANLLPLKKHMSSLEALLALSNTRTSEDQTYENPITFLPKEEVGIDADILDGILPNFGDINLDSKEHEWMKPFLDLRDQAVREIDSEETQEWLRPFLDLRDQAVANLQNDTELLELVKTMGVDLDQGSNLEG